MYFISGQSQDDVALPASVLQGKAKVFALGIKNAMLSQLNEIATNEENLQTVFEVLDFSQLDGISKTILDSLCTRTE